MELISRVNEKTSITGGSGQKNARRGAAYHSAAGLPDRKLSAEVFGSSNRDRKRPERLKRQFFFQQREDK